MLEVKIVGCDVDTLVLNVSYADKQFRPIKQELDADLQEVLSTLQDEARSSEAAAVTHWVFKGFNLFMQPKGSRRQCRWLLKSPLLSVVISIITLQRCGSLLSIFGRASTWLKRLSRLGTVPQLHVWGYLWLQVSEVDLCADVVGWDISQANWQECFISHTVGDDGRPRDEVLMLESECEASGAGIGY